MAKQELFERSPVRIYDNAANGGLKAGELGLITSKKGIGKTAVLVQFGLDTLLNGKQAVHVSYEKDTEWYRSVLAEISKNKSMDDDVKDQILRNLTGLKVSQDNFTLDKIVNTLNALKAGGFAVAGVVIDDIDFAKVKESDIQTLDAFAKATKTKVWISSTSEADDLAGQAPKAILPYFSHVVHLVASKAKGTEVKILKAGKKPVADAELKLDAKTALIVAK